VGHPRCFLLEYSEREFRGTNLPKAIGRYELVEHLIRWAAGFATALTTELGSGRVAAPRRYSMGNWLAADSTAAADVG
jgi:hypothetical protein